MHYLLLTDAQFCHYCLKCNYVFSDFFQRPDDHKNTLFIARLTEWNEDSAFAKGYVNNDVASPCSFCSQMKNEKLKVDVKVALKKLNSALSKIIL